MSNSRYEPAGKLIGYIANTMPRHISPFLRKLPLTEGHTAAEMNDRNRVQPDELPFASSVRI